MIYFTSDTHFGHKNILKYTKREGSNIEEMDENLIYKWNSAVGHKDTVYHLGDFSFYGTSRTLDIIKRLNGSIVLIRGNHDGVVKSEVAKRFEFIKDYYELRVTENGIHQKVVLCHYPFFSWHNMHMGAWHLHGHSHGSVPFQANLPRLDVGVDVHDGYPVSYDAIKALMFCVKFEPTDHHGRDRD